MNLAWKFSSRDHFFEIIPRDDKRFWISVLCWFTVRFCLLESPGWFMERTLLNPVETWFCLLESPGWFTENISLDPVDLRCCVLESFEAGSSFERNSEDCTCWFSLVPVESWCSSEMRVEIFPQKLPSYPESVRFFFSSLRHTRPNLNISSSERCVDDN